jgi:hypothetical protein
VKEIWTEIEIEAHPQVVWDVLTDFSAYPAWNPCLVEVRAHPRPGSRVDMVFRSSGRQFRLDATVLRADSRRELRWHGPISRIRGMFFRGEHYWTLRELHGGSSTHLAHGERFDGLLIPPMSRWLDREVGGGYHALNRALKARAEELGSGRG